MSYTTIRLQEDIDGSVSYLVGLHRAINAGDVEDVPDTTVAALKERDIKFEEIV